MGTSALTVKSNNGLLRQLSSPVDIIVPNTETRNQYNAIWDTGASASVITQEVVDNLGLIPTGMSIVNTAGGQVKQNTYIVDISLNAGITLIRYSNSGAPTSMPKRTTKNGKKK